MWAMAFAIYLGCKWLTWRRTPVDGAPAWKHIAYLACWAGMDPAAFLHPDTDRSVLRPTFGEWLLASANTLSGVVVLFVVARSVSPEHPLLVGWIGLVGLVLALHFGAFHLLSCAWRQAGVDARPLMVWPAAATSESDFWSRRWNTAFRDLCYRFVFRPLNKRVGLRWGILLGFIVSGLIHDLVISLPADGGFGGPTIYFGVQGGALLFERSKTGRALGLGRGLRGWLFTAMALIAPAFLLFHPPFIEQVVLPMLNAWRANP
jgi:alginate O-acetyltransferase complex protein AlgI